MWSALFLSALNYKQWNDSWHHVMTLWMKNAVSRKLWDCTRLCGQLWVCVCVCMFYSHYKQAYLAEAHTALFTNPLFSLSYSLLPSLTLWLRAPAVSTHNSTAFWLTVLLSLWTCSILTWVGMQWWRVPLLSVCVHDSKLFPFFFFFFLCPSSRGPRSPHHLHGDWKFGVRHLDP